METNDTTRPHGELLVYQGQGQDDPIQVRLEGDTVWLSQKQMAELYGTTVANVNQHISAIYDEEELLPEATIKKYLIVQTEGSRQVKRLIDHYNLDMILAVGFRVRSRRGSQFRRWANDRLSEYLVKGFTMDDERLKGSDAKRLTAAEIVKQRANAELPLMGLTNWKGARVLKADVGTAKNYLDSSEIDTLNRITVMFLDQAEFRAQRRQTILMADWTGFLDKFLADVELPVLDGAGSVRHDNALEFASEQYEQFADKRLCEAQRQADQRYIEDLKQTAAMLDRERKQGKDK